MAEELQRKSYYGKQQESQEKFFSVAHTAHPADRRLGDRYSDRPIDGHFAGYELLIN